MADDESFTFWDSLLWYRLCQVGRVLGFGVAVLLAAGVGGIVGGTFLEMTR